MKKFTVGFTSGRDSISFEADTFEIGPFGCIFYINKTNEGMLAVGSVSNTSDGDISEIISNEISEIISNEIC